jgi:coenzyme PQQ precursor peptide PqqA
MARQALQGTARGAASTTAESIPLTVSADLVDPGEPWYGVCFFTMSCVYCGHGRESRLGLLAATSGISFARRAGMQQRWSKPTYKDKRFGFEMTLYILNR